MNLVSKLSECSQISNEIELVTQSLEEQNHENSAVSFFVNDVFSYFFSTNLLKMHLLLRVFVFIMENKKNRQSRTIMRNESQSPGKNSSETSFVQGNANSFEVMKMLTVLLTGI